MDYYGLRGLPMDAYDKKNCVSIKSNLNNIYINIINDNIINTFNHIVRVNKSLNLFLLIIILLIITK